MRVSRLHIQEVSQSITPRDRAICLHIYEHRFLTTHQAARLFFSSEVRARTRLYALWRLRVLQRFRPERVTGSHPWYYVLDEVGMAICRASFGVNKLAYDRARALEQVYSPRLMHMTEVNDFFSHLAAARDGSIRMSTWLGERSCNEHWRGEVRPDGFAVVETTGARLGMALELDGGTESGSRLSDKLIDYARLAGGSDAPDLILFCFPSLEREAAQRDGLAGSAIPIVTGALADHAADVLGPNWLPVSEKARLSIGELAMRFGARTEERTVSI